MMTNACSNTNFIKSVIYILNDNILPNNELLIFNLLIILENQLCNINKSPSPRLPVTTEDDILCQF